MKIIKAPEFNVCECKICGTVFQPEAEDGFQYNSDYLGEINIYVRCPVCSRLVEVTVKKGGDDNA